MLGVSVLASHLGMLVAMWIVLILIGLAIVIRLVVGIRGSVSVSDLATTLTRPLLVDVLPLLILGVLTGIDGTHILMRIWFYAAAIVIVLRELMNIATALKTKL